MNAATVRMKRMEQLLELAQFYQGCSRKELARKLSRDPTKLVPKTGSPKLDLVMELASVLDWPVAEVASYLWTVQPASADRGAADFEALNRAAGEAHRAGRYRDMLDLARQAYAAAGTPQQRARACNREAGAWDGMGRYFEMLQATRRGLAEIDVGPQFRRMLESNLANAYYRLWALVEAGAIAGSLLEWFRDNPPDSPADRKTQAFAGYVAGHTYRRKLALEPLRGAGFAGEARAHLERARDQYLRLAEETGDVSLEGIARTCAGGLIEADVVLRNRSASDALAEICRALDEVQDPRDDLVGDRLESYGWWCIFGCNIALRHLDDERALQHHMAILTNKADEIADRLDNWSLRERVFTMQHTRRQRATRSSGFEIPCVIDSDDVRVIAGTMGRFPAFRETGWRILQSAQVVNAP